MLTDTPRGPDAGAAARIGHLAIPALLALLTLPLAAAAADTLPPRKAGLWEQRMTSSDEPKAEPTVTLQCTDAAAEKAFQDFGTGIGKQACSKNTMRREGDRWITESVCAFGNVKITSRSVVTGNFDSAYRMEVDSRYDPAFMGKTADHSVIEGKWVGACQAGQQPGDMILPGGQKLNIRQIQKQPAPR